MKTVSHFDGLYELSGRICRRQESGQLLCSLVSRSRRSTEHLTLKDPLLISALCYQSIVFLLKNKSCSAEQGEIGVHYSFLKVVVVQRSFVYIINLLLS